MEASLSFDQLKKLSENMKVEVPFTAVNTDDNVLLFLYMTDDIGKAERIKKRINYNRGAIFRTNKLIYRVDNTR